MKNQKGFIVPLLLGIIALFVIGGGVYIYKNKTTESTRLEKFGGISPYSEDRQYFCLKDNETVSNEDLINRKADFWISFYVKENAVWLNPFINHPSGTKLFSIPVASGKEYKGNGIDIVINDKGNQAVLKENGNIVFGRCLTISYGSGKDY